MNNRSSYLHLFSDAFFSVAVILGGFSIHYLQVYWVDPLLILVIALYVLRENCQSTMTAVHVLMLRAPEEIVLEDVTNELKRLTGIEDIHHVNIWRVDEHDIHFEAHVNVANILVSKTVRRVQSIEKGRRHSEGPGTAGAIFPG